MKKKKSILQELNKLRYKKVKTWRIKNPEKAKAQRTVFIALRNNTIKREICFCGNLKAEAHHDNYSKPLEVIWLCKEHHMEADILRRYRENNYQQGSLLTLYRRGDTMGVNQ